MAYAMDATLATFWVVQVLAFFVQQALITLNKDKLACLVFAPTAIL
jgi:hypothetical protein